jgi:2-hydroxy-3-oxopropionate reductase
MINMNIGFIGLGVMGQPMAGHLIAAGHSVQLHRVKEKSRSLVEMGGQAADSPKAVAEASDIVILMVPDTPDVETVLFGDEGVAEGLSAGKTVIDMSSISPVATRYFASRIAALDCAYLDAPVSGGEAGAKAASLSIMVGGAQKDFDRVLPVLEVMGKNITLVGGVGDGQTAKVANQIIVALTIGAVSEGLLFASKAGADPAKVRGARPRFIEDLGDAWPAHDRPDFRAGLPYFAAPEGYLQRARVGPQPQHVVALDRACARALQRLRSAGPWRAGSFGVDPRA